MPTVGAEGEQPLLERILAGEVGLGQGAIDPDHRRGVVPVVRRDRPAAQQRHAEGLEVARPCVPELGERLVLHPLRLRPPLDAEVAVDAPLLEWDEGDPAGPFDPGECLHRLAHRLVEARGHLVLRIARLRQGDLEGQHLLRLEPEVGAREHQERAQQQTGRGEEHHGERHLARHQEATEAPGPPARTDRAAALAQRVLDARGPRLERRHQGERDGHHRRGGGQEGEHPPVEADPGRHRQGGRRQLGEGDQAEPTEGEAEQCGRAHQHHRFGEELGGDLARAGPQGRPYRHLPPPAFGPQQRSWRRWRRRPGAPARCRRRATAAPGAPARPPPPGAA